MPEDDPPVDDNGQPIYQPQHGGCNYTQPLIRKEGLKLVTVNQRQSEDDDNGGEKLKMEDRKNLSAEQALVILKKIPDDDLKIMGLSLDEARPEWMILKVLPVPPMSVRPSVAVDGGTLRGEDDLTYSALKHHVTQCGI